MIFELIGNILIALAVCFTFIGVIGVFRFDNFYTKLMATAKIDTVAMVTLILGVSIRSGFSWFTLKALLIMVFVFLINPIIASKIAFNAREDELQQQEEKGEEENGN